MFSEERAARSCSLQGEVHGVAVACSLRELRRSLGMDYNTRAEWKEVCTSGSISWGTIGRDHESSKQQLGPGIKKQSRCRKLVLAAAFVSAAVVTVLVVITVAVPHNIPSFPLMRRDSSTLRYFVSNHVVASTAAAHFDSSQRTASIQEACRTAHYPEQCVVTLLSSHDSAAVTSAGGYGATGSKYFSFAGAAMDSAIGGVSNFYSFTTRLSPEYGYEQWAQKSCLELLSSSQEEMYTSLSLLFNVNPANDNQGSVMTDILTSVSAALTYHTSCLDAWDYSPGSLRDSLLEQGNPVGVLLANAVSLVASLVGQERASVGLNANTGNRRRNLLNEFFPGRSAEKLRDGSSPGCELTDDDGFPEWLRPGDRRILQATSNLTIVDATVAQDGTGQYTSIQQAVNAAPQLNPQRWVIQLGAGTYYENVVIPKNSTNLMFVGAGMGVTIITGSLSVIANNITTFLTATVGKQAACSRLHSGIQAPS